MTNENDTLRKLYLLPDPPAPPRSFQDAFKSIRTDLVGSRVPWQFALPQKAYRSFCEEQENYQTNFLSKLDLSYYQNVYLPTEELFTFLRPAKITTDMALFERFAEEDTAGHVQTFRPGSDGFTRHAPDYSRTKSVTGRLTTSSNGPRILNLQKDHRKILVSRFHQDTGLVVALDFKSLEPKVLLHATDQLVEHNQEERGEGEENIDIYQSLLNTVLENRSDLQSQLGRDDMKQLVVSELYGAGLARLQAMLPKSLSHRDVDWLSWLVKEYFRTDILLERLTSEWIKNDCKYILNGYGRPVATVSNNLLINHYVQSTAVDVAMIGFLSIVKYLEAISALERVVPLYLVHDAIVFDVHVDALPLVYSMAKIGACDIPSFAGSSKPITSLALKVDRLFAGP